MADRSLSVAEVATLRGTGRVAAFRWLKRNAPNYLIKRGGRWFITASAYASVLDDERPLDLRIERRLADLESKVDELAATAQDHERHIDAHAKALRHVHLLR